MKKLTSLWIVLASVVGFLLFSALFLGVWDGVPQNTKVQLSRDRVEQRITDWIVERNPRATIKDFSGFPRALLEESSASGLDWRLLLAIADKESDMRPDAVSPKGAVGLFQIMPATAAIIAKSRGLEYAPPSKGSLGTLGDPRANLRFAVAYFKDQVDHFGVNERALRAYNRGPSTAREHWPADRYAEDIALKYVALSARLPR